MLKRLALALTFATLPLHAGITELPDGVAVGAPVAEDPLTMLRAQLVGLEGFLPVTVPPAPACDPAREVVTRAVFVAADRWGTVETFWLRGPQNDTEFLRNALVARGADADNLMRLTGPGASYDGFAQAATALLAATECGDSVILQFSAFAFGPDTLAPSRGSGGPFSADEKAPSLASLATRNLEGWTDADAIIATGPFVVLNQGAPGRGDILSAAALSELVTLLRNRGADVSVILDVAGAESFALEDRQARVDPRVIWRETKAKAAVKRAPDTAFPTALVGSAGALSVYYGTEPGNSGQERRLPRHSDGSPDPDAKFYGVFSFQLASAILQADRTTAAALMRHMKGNAGREMRSINTRQSFTFAATEPDHDLVVEGRPDTPGTRGLIRILDPAPTRAADPLDSASLTLRGVVETAAQTMIVTVNGAVAQSTPDGGFTADLELQAGVNRIDVLAMTRDNQPITHSFELFFEGDMAALRGTGARYALLIANQDYPAGSGLAPLATPIGDAEALAAVLRDGYGFATEAVTPEGTALPLFLKNASRIAIETTLYELSRIAGAKDTVLIFYAGHGIYEQATQGAFWLPVDAKAGLPFSYLPAAAITDALLRLEAGSVLVISDSCYSGALLRGEAVAETVEGDRLRALQRLAAKRSRIVIASGGNEPVLDGGGDGHSVFAQALLTGLEEMDEQAFSARELFDRYLLPMVVGRAAQEPQYRPIERSGHEGGDVVLARDG